MKIRLSFISLLVSLSFFSGFAQQQYNTVIVKDTIPVNMQNIYRLSNPAIIPYTEYIMLRGNRLRPGDYSITYSSSTISLSDSLPYSVFDTIYITYKAYDLQFKAEYKKRTLVYKKDEKTGDTIRVAQTERTGFSPDAIFGADMEKSGTLVRGFTVGTTKDFTLNSGLRLQLSGKLSDDIEVVAALTDENSPIQPEGNTERLEELDKVFIQIKHPYATGIFGDYQLTRSAGEFGFINRKLQGLTGEFNYEGYNAFVSVAGSKGKFNTNNLLGIEGVQGPYRLSGINNEKDIIVLAGTEKVYIDGIEMKRGEGNDYTIEYANAQITFTPRRLITSASRLTVDFEYTDRRFSRNFFGAGTGAEFFQKKLAFSFQYLREGDDQNAPIDITLTDEDKAILKAAGDDRMKAVKSGISLAPPDSSGAIKGLYTRIDTLMNGDPYSYYRYNPGDTSSVYNVSFSYIGEYQGDYIRQSLGNYTFVGINQGNYMPVIFLPLPELKQVGNAVLSYSPDKDISLSVEYAGSLWDRNRFSTLDDNNNFGTARNIFLKVNPREIKIGDLNFGKAGISYKDRFVQDKFTSADRINEIEFNRLYNTGDTETGNEQLRELKLTLLPVEDLQVNSMYGYLARGNAFKSNRFNNTLHFGTGKDYIVNYNFDYVQSENSFQKSYWARQRGDASYLIWKLRPGVEFQAEDRKDKITDTDSLGSSSLRYDEIIPFLEVPDIEGFKLSARYSFRNDFFPIGGIMYKESFSATQMYEASYSGLKEFSSTLNFTYRNKKYTSDFRNLGRLNQETILIRSQSRFNFWNPVNGDLFYEVSTQRSARLERVFIKVEKGTGNYIYLGDLNNNNIADENEYQPALYDADYILVTIPTDELYPVIDLKASTRWKINFEDIFTAKSLLGNLLSPISTETFWRIEENSTESDYKKIYLLNFASLMNEKTTIRGTNNFQQDLFIFENDPELSFRLRYGQRRNMSQYSGGMETGFYRERTVRIIFKLVEEISNQTDLENITDNVGAPVFSNRKRELTSNGITTDFSYRPEKNIEVGFKLKAAKNEDFYPKNPTIIDFNAVALRFNLSFAGTGRLRVEIERNELISNNLENYLPFELTNGNYIGKNYFWRVNFDYRISANLQATLNYDGRYQGTSKAIHTGRAEVRAFF